MGSEGREKTSRMSTREDRRIERFLPKSPTHVPTVLVTSRSDPLRALLISLIAPAMIHAVPMHIARSDAFTRSGKRIG